MIDPMASFRAACLQAHPGHAGDRRGVMLALAARGLWSGCDDRLGDTVMAYGKWNGNNWITATEDE
ncbi:hypothetical protein AXG89_00490 [Burkholderia sp. PAMC 26561]|nr:hypothetical protein AXG89_00490 [Burkholderia sp. PAMC 26561]